MSLGITSPLRELFLLACDHVATVHHKENIFKICGRSCNNVFVVSSAKHFHVVMNLFRSRVNVYTVLLDGCFCCIMSGVEVLIWLIPLTLHRQNGSRKVQSVITLKTLHFDVKSGLNFSRH